MIRPPLLHPGDTICVISPSRSASIIGSECIQIAKERFEKELGLTVTFGHLSTAEGAAGVDQNPNIIIPEKIKEIHSAFADEKVKGIFTMIGGFNSNQILPFLDYTLISSNPKILCGFSDITALQTAITTKTGLVTFSGPHFSSFGMKHGFEYTLDYVKKTLMDDGSSTRSVVIHSSPKWRDEMWFLKQDSPTLLDTNGYEVLSAYNYETVSQESEAAWSSPPMNVHLSCFTAEGRIVGANNTVFLTLTGTEYIPTFRNVGPFVFFCEFCAEWDPSLNWVFFEQQLFHLIQLDGFVDNIQALCLGRFEQAVKVSSQDIRCLFDRWNMSMYQLCKQRKSSRKQSIPIAFNLDFGHTTPIFTIPIGGQARLEYDLQAGSKSLTLSF